MRLAKSFISLSLALAAAVLDSTTSVAGAQGRGRDKDKSDRSKDIIKAERQGNRGPGGDRPFKSLRRFDDDNRGRARRVDDDQRDRNNDNNKNRDRSDDLRIVTESRGDVARNLVVSDRRGGRIAGLAVARAAKRGVSDEAFAITALDDRVQVLNRNGVVLVDFDRDRELGNWTVVTTPFQNTRGAPSFCRSGAGHPVWGRQWCIDKGLGLGVDDDVRWARVIDPSDVIITRPRSSDLTRDVLVGVLGSVVLNRLATHAITLGLEEPLTGRWLGEPLDTGPRVLLLSSGRRPVAEVVDLNRDDRADMLVVAVRP